MVTRRKSPGFTTIWTWSSISDMALIGALKSAYARPLLHLLCLLPLFLLLWAVVTDELGPNPVETLTFETGQWTLRFLLITLAISPLRQWTGQVVWLRYRRMFGLYAFFYCCCHFLTWLVFDHSLDLGAMFEDILKRPYITLGFSALMCMLPLAITSNQAMIRRLGRKWKSLHQLVYLVIVLGVLHFLWLTRADYLEPGIYAIIAVVLLMHRIGPMKRLGARSHPATR